MTTTRYAVVDVPTVGPHKGKITKVWDFNLHFSDAHVLKKRIANKRWSSCPTVLTEAEIKEHPRIGDAELRQPTETEIADLKIDAKKFAGMTKEQEDKLVAELAGELGAAIDPIVEAAKATTPNLPPVTKHADGRLTVGPPPDGRSVKEHLDALATVGPSSSDLSTTGIFQVDAETLLRQRAVLQGNIDSLKAVMEPMHSTEAGKAQAPKHWPYELERMEGELKKIDAEIARRTAATSLAGIDDLSDATKADLDAIEDRVRATIPDPADVTIGVGTNGKWFFWETEYPEDMMNGPHDDEAACRAAVERFYKGGENPFGTGKTEYEIRHVRRKVTSNADGSFTIERDAPGATLTAAIITAKP